MRIKLYIIILLLFFTEYTIAQTIEWQNTIGGDGDDWLSFIEKSKDGNLLVGGYHSSTVSGDVNEATKGTSDYWLMKIDNVSGNIIWQKSVGGDYIDHLTSVKETSDGGYILGGFTRSNKSGDLSENLIGEVDYWVLKLDSDRNIIWEKRYGGTDIDRLYSIIETDDGGFIMGGESHSNISGNKTENSRGENDYWVIKIDQDGNILWQKTYGGSDKDILRSVLKATDGGYLLTGTSYSNISGEKNEVNRGFGDYWILKIDNAGNIIWQHTFGGNNGDNVNSAIITHDGNYVIVGQSSSNISGEKTSNSICDSIDIWVIKLSTAGDILWQKTLGGNDTETNGSVVETIDHGLLIGALSYSDISGYKTENSRGNGDYWVVKLNEESGKFLWDKTYGGSDSDSLWAIEQSDDGDFVLGGWSKSNVSNDKTENSNGSMDFWIIKFSMDVNNYVLENAELVTFCFNEDLALNGPGGGITYQWIGPDGFLSNEQNPIIKNPSSINEGIYNLEVTYTDNCLTEYKMYRASASSAFGAGLDGSITVNRGDAPFDLFDIIGGNPITGGIWSPRLVSGTGIFDPSEDIEGKYVYRIGECGEHATVTVNILDISISLDYPRFFSPNNDGINDTWQLIGDIDLNYKLYIFDRFGKLLKQLDNTNYFWTGFYNGKLQTPDDYWFKLVFENGIVKSGHFALLK